MPRRAYVGIDVACAKKKRLPLIVCVLEDGRLEPLRLRECGTKPPSGEGNLKALDHESRERFALATVAYLRDIELTFNARIECIAIDAPSAPASEACAGRRCEISLSNAGLSYFKTPSQGQFDEIAEKVREHVRSGGRESHLPHAQQLWMLVGFALFKSLSKCWECIEVFPHAIVHALGVAGEHKTSEAGYWSQLAAVARNTRTDPESLNAALTAAGFGSRHDRLDAYLSAWVASLDPQDRETHGIPPDDAIWVPKQQFLKLEPRMLVPG